MFRRIARRLAGNPTSVSEGYSNMGTAIAGAKNRRKTSIQVTIPYNEPGSLLKLLHIFQNESISLTRISSRDMPEEDTRDFITMFLDFDHLSTEANVQRALGEVRKKYPYSSVTGSWEIPYFPKCIEDLDLLDQSTLAAGAELVDDPENPHPGFHDEAYKARRRAIAEAGKAYKYGMKLPDIAYTKEDIQTWGAVWDRLTELYPTHACKEFNYVLPLLVENCGFRRDNIPQLSQVSAYLREVTGFTVRPVTGLLSPRDFLNGLAFRVFHATQYIRHPSKPLYTPEPDVVHELMGHIPLLADPEFADFTQTVGLASLGATDEDIKRLAACYWYSVEFGLCKQGNSVRAYGAGILSSFGELKYCVGPKPKLLPWDPFVACNMQDYPITEYQPRYFVAEDFSDAKLKMQRYADTLERPFTVKYNPTRQRVLTFSKNSAQ